MCIYVYEWPYNILLFFVNSFSKKKNLNQRKNKTDGGYRTFVLQTTPTLKPYNLTKMLTKKKTLEYCLSPVVVIIVIIFDAICQAFNWVGCVRGN